MHSPELLSLLSQKFYFMHVGAVHPSLVDLGVLRVVMVIFNEEVVPDLGLLDLNAPDQVMIYPIDELDVSADPAGTNSFPAHLFEPYRASGLLRVRLPDGSKIIC